MSHGVAQLLAVVVGSALCSGAAFAQSESKASQSASIAGKAAAKAPSTKALPERKRYEFANSSAADAGKLRQSQVQEPVQPLAAPKEKSGCHSMASDA
jgi:hypothetical protein